MSKHTECCILLNLKKELNSDTCHNMDEPWRHYVTEYKPTQNDKHGVIPLTWSTTQIHRDKK